MRLAVLSAFLGLSIACFTEPSADRVWRCSVDQPLCPEGQTCINDWCTKDGTALPDLSVVDSTVADMSTLPCQDGFPIGTQGVWACRGKFSATTTKASALCLSGYKLCADAFKITDTECSSSSLKGFYFAEAPATGATGAAVKCAGVGPSWGGYWFGCGSIQDKPLTERAAMACRGFFPVSLCYSSVFVCDFTDGHLDKQRNDDSRNGVLCCPP